jgi:general secretion pathway protein K
MTRRDDLGFALLAVLWVVVALGALGLAARLAARESVATTQNRIALAHARWDAEGCIERARLLIDRALREASAEGPSGPTWLTLPERIHAAPLLGDCAVELRAVGTRLDANAADRSTLLRLFRAAGCMEAQADSLADALLDWRDDDDRPRQFGSEGPDSDDRGPRNGPFAAAAEILQVRGMTALSGIDTLLDVEPGRVSLNHAPRAVLASLPGMSEEAAARILESRAGGEWVADPAALEARLSTDARQELQRGFTALSVAAAVEPDAWLLFGRAETGGRVAVVELRLVRAGGRASVARRRSWVQ